MIAELRGVIAAPPFLCPPPPAVDQPESQLTAASIVTLPSVDQALKATNRFTVCPGWTVAHRTDRYKRLSI